MKIKNILIKFNLIKVNDWIINHLGINPKKGGIPPKDKIEVIKKNFNK